MKIKSLAFITMLSILFIACSQNNEKASTSDQASDTRIMHNNLSALDNTDIPYMQFYDNKTFIERDAWSNPFQIPKDTMTAKISNASYENTSLCFSKFEIKRETCKWEKLKMFAIQEPTIFKWNKSQSAWFISFETEAKFKSKWEQIMKDQTYDTKSYDGRTLYANLQIALSNIADASRSSVIPFRVSKNEIVEPNTTETYVQFTTPLKNPNVNTVPGIMNMPLNLNEPLVAEIRNSNYDNTYITIYDIKDATTIINSSPLANYGVGTTTYYNFKDLEAKYPGIVSFKYNTGWIISMETVDKFKANVQNFVNRDAIGNTAYYKYAVWTCPSSLIS